MSMRRDLSQGLVTSHNTWYFECSRDVLSFPRYFGIFNNDLNITTVVNAANHKLKYDLLYYSSHDKA